jgi:hypothetical protein
MQEKPKLAPEIAWNDFIDAFLDQKNMRERINYLVEVAEDFGIYVAAPQPWETIIIHDADEVKLISYLYYTIRYTRTKPSDTLSVSIDIVTPRGGTHA